MQWKSMLAIVSVAVLLTGSALVRAETAAETFAQGEAKLAKGDYPSALESFAAAARAERNNAGYVQRYALVRRIVDLRTRLETEQDPQRWEYMARALRAFYVSERIYPDLLKIDQALHSRLNSADTAAMLAETQLALDLNAEAVKMLAALEADKATPMTRSLLGIAVARTGKTDEAKRIAGQLHLPDDARPGTTYAAARLHAAIGDSAVAVKLLASCFEATLPSMLEGFKAHAKACPEFAAIASTPEFATALNTQSKMPESKCSGGSSCAGCPMSGKCPKSQEQKP
jgi:Flp pilus assembly protein TadD